MGRKSLLIFVCVLALSRANPITPSGSSTPVEGSKPDPEVQDLLVKPQESVSKDEPSKVVKEEKDPVDVVKDEETPVAAPEEPKRDARLLKNEVTNDISSLQDNEVLLLQKLNNKCSQKDISSCFLLKLVAYMNRLLKKSNIEVIEGVHITQTASEAQVDQESLPRSSSSDDEESQLTTLLTNKLWTFVRTRSLRWSILPDADVVVSASPEEEGGVINVGMSIKTSKAIEKGRGKKGGGGGIAIVALAALKAAAIGLLGFKAVALLVGKALIVSKIALVLAALVGLKSLFNQQKHVTYEVVAHPHHSHSSVHSSEHHGHGHGGGDSYSSGWGRSVDTQAAAHQMAYSAYAAQSSTH